MTVYCALGQQHGGKVRCRQMEDETWTAQDANFDRNDQFYLTL